MASKQRMATVAAKMTVDEKQQFFAAAQAAGITPSNVMRIMARHFASTGELPLSSPTNSQPTPSASLAQAAIPAGATAEAQDWLLTDAVVESLTSEPLGSAFSWRLDYPAVPLVITCPQQSAGTQTRQSQAA